MEKLDSHLIPEKNCSFSWPSREMNLLQQITQEIAEATDFYCALEKTMETFCKATKWDYAEAWIPGKGLLHCGPIWKNESLRLNEFGELSKTCTFKKGLGSVGRIWENKLPEWIADITTTDQTFFYRIEAATRAGLKASFGVPLIIGDDVKLILIFFLSKPCKEDENLMNLITTVATQLGGIIRRKETEARFANAFYQSTAGKAFIDFEGNFIEVNSSLTRFLGYSKVELLRMNVRQVLDEKAQDRFLINAQQLLAGQKFLLNYECKLFNNDAKPIWLDLNLNLVKDSMNRPVCFSCQFIDITKVKETEEEKIRLKKELEDVNEQVKNLKVLLPICAWCRDIRDDKGYWQKIEDYISRNSDFDFTHGICPECIDKLT